MPAATFSQTLTLIVFLLPLAWSPGPGNLFFAALGAQAGLRASLRASAGYHLATWIVTAMIGLGLAVVSAQAWQALGLVGAGYVFWLATRFWRAGQPGTGAAGPYRSGRFRDGALILLLNPKAYAIVLAMFTQFLPSGADIRQVIWITTIFTLNNLVAFTVWTWASAAVLAQWHHPHRAIYLNRASAVLLALTATWMIIDHLSG